MKKSNEALEGWIIDALNSLEGGSGTIVQIAKHIWDNHKGDLENSETLFFTWQYQMRWAGQRLVNLRKMRKAKGKNGVGIWELLPEKGHA